MPPINMYRYKDKFYGIVYIEINGEYILLAARDDDDQSEVKLILEESFNRLLRKSEKLAKESAE